MSVEIKPFDDKQIEYSRYNARTIDDVGGIEALKVSGSKGIPIPLRSPYEYYESIIRSIARPGLKVLDVCAGTGLHSLTAAQCGAEVIVTDLAENSLEIARVRAEAAGIYTIKFIPCDAESLPFSDSEFDLVTCAGSLSYVDLNVFMASIKRLLKPGGVFLAVDSFNHNPIYRFNRFLHYLKGRRSLSTLNRMPNNNTLKKLKTYFEKIEIEYFGIFSFTAFFLSKLTNAERTKNIIDSLDNKFSFWKKFSFKIVIIARK